MTVFRTISLTDDADQALVRLAAQSVGRTPESLLAEAAETFIKSREEARRRIAEAPFLFERRNRAR